MGRKLGKDQFIRVRAEFVTDPRDNTRYRDWDNATETVVTDCSVQPFRLAEKLNFEINKEREFSRTALRFFCPPGTDIEATDRVIYRGDDYEVFGHAGKWTNFKGVVDHVAFIGRRREG